MKKLLIAIIVLIVFVGAGGALAYWYVSPDKKLDLQYEEVPLEQRGLDMLRRLSTELVLTEADVNNLAKASIARNPQYSKDVVIQGAAFRLSGTDRLVADLNIRVADRVPVGLTLTYRLSWDDPNLTATVEKASVKDVGLPADNFDDVVIPLGRELPKLMKVKDVNVRDGEVVVSFHKPTLKDLQDLLR
ncbi:hypothetical protein [Cohnella nanjingensis]|uniref:DUF2140 family protein n=1 Tax=Cohnella nanjingensis TaxID=1387779 RepID=A0A7X0VI10_9BACL|nr:hypothetical protein [Cohnella nanjingensis]MBB6674471.1 hypothetical protein [Cohnella nanjingensis]